jgi:hypothetical protein
MNIRLVSSCALVLLVGTGCSEKIKNQLVQNMPPEIRLTQAPVSTGEDYFYAYRMNWVGYDPDGRVDYFMIAVDPDDPAVIDTTTRSGFPVWQRTAKNEEIVFFRATKPDTNDLGVALRSNEFHTFAVAAVDNQGATSPPVWRTFTSYTVVPSVTITSPRPNPYATPIVTPSVRINWTGVDPDGQFTVKPVKYKFKLFRPRDPDFPGVNDPVGEILSNPKILRWKYAPTFGPTDSCPTCSYWDSSSGETTNVQYTNLIPNNTYAFAVTGYDEAGAYDPNFSRLTNVLKIFVSYAGALGPQICMFNQYFNYCYVSGGYANDPTRYFNVEVPADQRVTFNWFATPPEGADIRHYRWVLDLVDLTDETPREDENDLGHWSPYSLQTTSATLPEFRNNGEIHLFFIEAEDNNGLRSLGIIRFTVVKATFERDLLFVDDTRLSPDALINGQWETPRGVWPTASELDTFFFAKGGKPWIGYPGWNPTPPHDPNVTLSPVGIFDGFEYDTVGTRGTVSGLVPLATLGKYKTVVWYVDDISSAYTGNPTDLLGPITSLRAMSSPGRPSTISTYLQQGGRLWLFGGGAGYATMAPWNRRNTPPDEFDNTSNEPELRPGRFMYDFTHWRSAFSIRPAQFALLNVAQFRPVYPNAAVGRGPWSGHGIHRDLIMPNYGKLLTAVPFLGPRSCTSDPPSPLRTCDSYYLIGLYSAEFMGTLGTIGTNNIVEDADPDLDIVREESTLDTMYFTVGGTTPYGRPVMTYYHGFESPQMVFSGFPLWHFQRAQARALGDFVLRDIFGLPRAGAVATPSRLRASASSTPTTVERRWAAPSLRR